MAPLLTKKSGSFFKKALAIYQKSCYNVQRAIAPYIRFLPVAQLDSASDSDSEGQRFESAWVGQKINTGHRPVFIF